MLRDESLASTTEGSVRWNVLAVPGAGRLVSDERLARRAAHGDRRAFAAIYDRYHQPLYGYCLAILGDVQEAQDALQNTMVKAMRALPGERREIRLKPWLYRIAHNESIDLARARRPLQALDLELEAAGERERTEWRERLRALLADVERLPERQRGALLMRELGGFSYEEISYALDATPAAARQSVHEARLSLRRMDAEREEPSATLSDLAAVAPLPAAAAAEVLRHVLGGAGGSGGSGVAGGAVSGGAKVLGGSVVLKSAATVAVVAVIGTGVAERSGVIGGGDPGGSGVALTGHGDGATAGMPSARPVSLSSRSDHPGGAASGTRSRSHGRTPADGTGAAAGSPASTVPSRPGAETNAAEAPTFAARGHGAAEKQGGGEAASDSEAGQPSKPEISHPGPASNPGAAGPPMTPPGQGGTPPGLGGPPPGHGGTPPGQERTPPGQGGTPPGQEGTPPGQGGAPPGQGGAPPGQGGTPPGQERTPPGQEGTPPGHGGTPPGQAEKGE